jgi:hypothetical protein
MNMVKVNFSCGVSSCRYETGVFIIVSYLLQFLNYINSIIFPSFNVLRASEYASVIECSDHDPTVTKAPGSAALIAAACQLINSRILLNFKLIKLTVRISLNDI